MAFLSLKKKEIRIASYRDYRIYVNISEYAGVSLYFLGSSHEIFSTEIVCKLIHRGDICVDIGANMGIYTFSMASCTGNEGKVFAFEPNSELYELLANSIKINSASEFIFIETRPCYSISGEKLKFYLSQSANNSGTSSLVNHGVFVNRDNFIIVETVSLRKCLKSFKSPFIKW